MEERRSFLKRTGLVLLSLAGSTVLAPSIGKTTTKHQTQPAMIIDVNRCMGCHSCIIACKEQNLTPAGFFNTTVEIAEHGSYPKSWMAYTPNQCHQCHNAPCVKICPTEASIQLSSGIVIIDWETCIGDGACVKVCPYNARFLDPQHGNKADKCDFCLPRLEKGLEPACVDSCPSHARIFGDLANPEGEFATYLSQMTSENSHTVDTNGLRLCHTSASKR